jgi:hypothetical protein
MKPETYEAMKKFSDLVTADLGMEPIKFGAHQWAMFAPISNYQAWVWAKIMRAIVCLCDHNMPGVVRQLNFAVDNAEQAIEYEQSQTDE